MIRKFFSAPLTRICLVLAIGLSICSAGCFYDRDHDHGHDWHHHDDHW